MHQGPEQHDRRLLLISRGLPDAQGDPRAVRAWQLLTLAATDYQVDLVCLDGRRPHMTAWTDAAERCRRMALCCAPGYWRSLPMRAWAQALGWLDDQPAWLPAWLKDLSPYQVILCTDPDCVELVNLLRRVRGPSAGLPRLICDLHLPRSVSHRQQLRRCLAPLRRYHRWQAQRQAEIEFTSLVRCALVMTSDHRDAESLRQQGLTAYHLGTSADPADLVAMPAAKRASARRIPIDEQPVARAA
ncbi:MAG: hypothetical protein IT442_07205 [Phycisphaeraceae bacterium]|nr:hypothetical protein [Phycisphaeraceae bacterium]